MDKSRQQEPGPREDPDRARSALPVNPTDHSGSSELAPRNHHFAVRRKLVAQLTARQELLTWSRSLPPADVDSLGRSPAFRHLLIPSCLSCIRFFQFDVLAKLPAGLRDRAHLRICNF